ncbi:branched-chain amino acid ABC transporter permease [Acuticoccus mangrovi]|uniref:Branched-chain amino acid ABC transporter permease n=1 Tax=Acuticoccus mangrovi TaxID=2796142 RepID=A0A934INI0_9HYPH|nr:branched-chain amino acid ABC transporter permease [Acuticoccus mangrovi]MBJ3775835.1 branched-chain amino acid ABC transporter permease [Acuticoccus mangrovi]
MDTTLLLVQLLNGLQLGVLLFLVAAGLTLVFGIMDFINLAHGVQYMVGAYLGVVFLALTGSFLLTIPLVLVGSFLIAVVLEHLVFRKLYRASHLSQVLATVGVLLFITELVEIIFGPQLYQIPIPAFLDGAVPLTDTLQYPVYRLVVIGLGLMLAVALWLAVSKTRLGALVRAGATDAEMVSALGVDVERLFLFVFAFGGMLAGFAGLVAAPIVAVEAHMGNQVLILCFVVIVIGGIGSIEGAFLGALIVALVDTLGRTFTTDIMKLLVDPSAATTIGPALASMLIYLLMAVVLFFKPRGLYPAKA